MDKDKIIQMKDKNSNKLYPNILIPDLKYGQVVKTNEKRDGKDVYAKLIKVESLPNNTTIKYQSGISGFDKIWLDESNSFIIFASRNIASFPYYGGTNNIDTEFLNIINDGTFQIRTTKDRSTASADIVLKFTLKN